MFLVCVFAFFSDDFSSQFNLLVNMFLILCFLAFLLFSVFAENNFLYSRWPHIQASPLNPFTPHSQ